MQATDPEVTRRGNRVEYASSSHRVMTPAGGRALLGFRRAVIAQGKKPGRLHPVVASAMLDAVSQETKVQEIRLRLDAIDREIDAQMAKLDGATKHRAA